VVARELTKLHESLYRGSLAELCVRSRLDADFARGEIVIVIAGEPPPPQQQGSAELDRVLGLLLAELPLKQAARLAAQILGARDNEAYKSALRLKQESGSP
jgi:16S rRNA (cytidine1402-2'-O)-methyltransferase